MKRIAVLYFLVVSTIAMGQNSRSDNYPFYRWTKEILNKANTARNVIYMNSTESEVIFYCNLARLDGKLFAETYLQQYIDSLGMEKDEYVRSLFRDLRNVRNLNLLEPDYDLYQVAKGHAAKSGETGHVGHKDFNKRFKKILNNYSRGVAENCDYGNENAIDIFFSLLIDRGVKTLGHRINILDKNYNRIGVSVAPHKIYRVNCVMDFGGK